MGTFKRNNYKKEKYTIKHFNEDYPNDDACLDKIFQKRYGDLKICPHCQKATSFHRVSNRKCYACSQCGHQLHPLANTIFHKSSTSLRSWFYAMFLFAASKNGVSGKELERQLGVTYKTAWRMGQQIRKLFAENQPLLDGIVEADEVFIGGKESNKHENKKSLTKGHGVDDKNTVIGAVERDGVIIAKVVNDTKMSTMESFVEESIADENTMLITDEAMHYSFVQFSMREHRTIRHSLKEYCINGIHTNTIEGFWGILKRCISGTHIWVSKKYLQRYVDEFAYKYNRRHIFRAIFKDMIDGVG